MTELSPNLHDRTFSGGGGGGGEGERSAIIKTDKNLPVFVFSIDISMDSV